MSSEEQSVCRDFERGVCNRGDKCRYFHPEGVKPSDNAKLPICKDFQNRGCDRMKCKFLHITVDEEAEYNKTGTLPEHGGRSENVPMRSGQGKAICKYFLKNTCERGESCRFLHEREWPMGEPNGMPNGMGMMGGPMYGKRYRDDFGGASGSPALMDENEMLKRKITDLKKQVLELRQMNDTLYDQNTRYRNQLHGNPALANPAQTTDAYNKTGLINTGMPTGAAPPAPPVMIASLPGYNYSQLKY